MKVAITCVVLSSTVALADPVINLTAPLSPSAPINLGSSNEQHLQDGVNLLINGSKGADYSRVIANTTANAQIAVENQKVAAAQNAAAETYRVAADRRAPTRARALLSSRRSRSRR